MQKIIDVREVMLLISIFLLSFYLYAIEKRFLGFVWYDKVLHFGVGLFFMMNYVKVEPNDSIFPTALLFTATYELLVEFLYPIVPAILINNENIWIFSKEFILRYTTFDEWLDVIVTLLGCMSILLFNINSSDKS